MTRKQSKLVNAVRSVNKSHSNRDGRVCQFEALESRTLMSAAPLLAPTALTATAQNATSVSLQWKDPAAAVSGYDVFRSTDNVHFLQVGSVIPPTATSYMDKTVTSGQQYEYELKSVGAGGASSIPSNIAKVATPLATPVAISAVANTFGVQVTWKNIDPYATGCYLGRSTDGGSFVTVLIANGANVVSFTDINAKAGHTYSYEVVDYSNVSISAPSNIVSTATPLLAPSKLTAVASGFVVQLSWTGNDSRATGYSVLRSTDGVNFAAIATLTSSAATTYADETAAVGQKYWYEIVASDALGVSNASAAATATIPPQPDDVAIATRYGGELAITANGPADTVSVSQSGNSLVIDADGQTTSAALPADGLFVYTRGGDDVINIGNVVVPATVETIDGAATDISSSDSNLNAWIDANDVFTGTGSIHRVSSFTGGVSKAAGAALPDPTDSGTTTKVNLSLFGSGPVPNDVNQGSVGDCYFLAPLAAFAANDPSILTQSAVDMGDGTYVVQFMSKDNPVYVRVSNDMPTGNWNGFNFAHPGANNTIWAMVMEKAFAYFRNGANTYASISGGFTSEPYMDFGVPYNSFNPASYTQSAFYQMVSTDLADGEPVALSTLSQNAPNLVSDHVYTLISATTNASGVTQYVVRNPWGFSGDSLENSLGYATISFAQLLANFNGGCQAT